MGCSVANRTRLILSPCLRVLVLVLLAAFCFELGYNSGFTQGQWSLTRERMEAADEAIHANLVARAGSNDVFPEGGTKAGFEPRPANFARAGMPLAVLPGIAAAPHTALAARPAATPRPSKS
jgi:hypothetical protein